MKLPPLDQDPSGWQRQLSDWAALNLTTDQCNALNPAICEATRRVLDLVADKSALARQNAILLAALEKGRELNAHMLRTTEIFRDSMVGAFRSTEPTRTTGDRDELLARIALLEHHLTTPQLAGMESQLQGMLIEMKGPAVEFVAGMFLQMADQHVVEAASPLNYMETRVRAGHHGDLLVTVQRVEGASAHELRRRAETHVAVLTETLTQHGLPLPYLPSVLQSSDTACVAESQSPTPSLGEVEDRVVSVHQGNRCSGTNSPSAR